MVEIRHLENRHDIIFSAQSGPIWIKLRRLVQNDISTAVMWSKSKPDVEFQKSDVWANSVACHPRATCHTAVCCHLTNSMSWFQSYVSHCRMLPLGEFTVAIPEPHTTLELQGVRIPSSILKIVFRHILFFLFLMQFRLWRAGFQFPLERIQR